MNERAVEVATTATATAAAERLAAAGARAVVLTGSHAGGDAHEWSDVDLLAVGGGGFEMRMQDGLLLAEAWTTVDDVRAGFRDPGAVGTNVPGWREAVVLHDPDGVAAELQAEAVAWRWEDLGDRADRWVATEVTGLAEEVYRLVGHLRSGRRMPAAVMRNVLANRMAGIAAVHLRLLYRTENRLWDRVAGELGDGWATDQSASLALPPSSDLAASGRAALRLYGRVASLTRSLLSRTQREVVDAAVTLAVTEAGTAASSSAGPAVDG